MLFNMLPGPVRRGRTEMKSRSPMAVIPPDLKGTEIIVKFSHFGHFVSCSSSDLYSNLSPMIFCPVSIARVLLLSVCSVLFTAGLRAEIGKLNGEATFKQGERWLDTEGNPINAHGAGILYQNGTYYLYGEYKKGKTTRVARLTGWECMRVEALGVSCYSSRDLRNWKFEGLALRAEEKDSASDVHTSKVIERPKVIFNDKTGKFVMWMHVDSEDYLYARAGVAVSDSPTGPFVYQGSIRPNGQMSRDQTLFKDDDGKAYQICSSENNATLWVNELSRDYMKTTGRHKRIFIGKSREAPAMVKHAGKYYLISSGCTGWDPNQADLAVADQVMGDYVSLGNPCQGKDADKTFYAQSTHILRVEGKPGTYLALFDRWNKNDLEGSSYIWLPMRFEDGRASIPWQDSWQP